MNAAPTRDGPTAAGEPGNERRSYRRAFGIGAAVLGIWYAAILVPVGLAVRGWLDGSATEDCAGLDFACGLGPILAAVVVVATYALFVVVSVIALSLLALRVRSGLLAGHLALLAGVAGLDD